jgi:hypothetical protein
VTAPRPTRLAIHGVISTVWLTAALGCASTPYVATTAADDATLALRPGETRVERGRPQVFVDGLGHYLFSLPVKLALLSWHVENHDVSPETETALLEYLDENQLCRVKVRINQYAPGGEYSRLFRNRDVGGFWRYTFGLLSVTLYTIFPERVFGGDNYNPFTNTVHIYSDESAVALHEGGHAKDFAERTHKGLYAAVRILPIVPLYQEGVATSDAVSYLRAEDPPKEPKAYPLLWAAWGTYLAGEATQWFVEGPIVYAIVIPVAWIGRGVGTVHAWLLPDPDPASEHAELVLPEAVVEEPLRCEPPPVPEDALP